MKKRKVAYITGTRADFGLMSPVLREIEKNKKLDLQLYVTGMHLMKEFGSTKSEVLKLFPNSKIIDARYSKDDRESMALFGSMLSQKLIRVFGKNRPDITLTLGDRMEMLQVAISSAYLGIPSAHVHGGDKTKTVDEIVRHAITKLSHIHFPATNDAAKRIAKMGEDNWRINVVGAPALDVVLNHKLPTRGKLLNFLNINDRFGFVLVTLHPVSGREKTSDIDMKTVLDSVLGFDKTIVVTFPNADAGGRKMIPVINNYTQKYTNIYSYPSIPFEYFLALERECDVWVGNSSAAMIESSSFGTPVVNVGDRQKGRLHGKNVINVDYKSEQIKNAVKKSLNKKYKNKLKKLKNPWGDGKAAERIVKVLENIKINDKLLVKQIAY